MASSTPSSELAGYGPPEDAAGAHTLDGYGPPEPIEDARVDMGPEARKALTPRPRMPTQKSDEELGIDEGPKFSREFPQWQRKGKTVFGLSGTIVPDAKSAPGTNAYRGAHSGDEMNDPIAQMITGAAIAAPIAELAPAAIAPGVSGAVQAGAQGQDPITGFGLGMIPRVPGAAQAARDAIGEAAFNRATTKGFGSGPGMVTKLIGKGVGAVAGGASHGPLGMLVGHSLGGRAANAISSAGDAATNALARRWLDREIANATIPDMVRLPATATAPLPGSVPGSPLATPRATGYLPDAPPVPAPRQISLAPLVPAGPKLPTEVPPGAFGTPFLDEISGEPVTMVGRGGFLPEEATTNVGGKLPDKTFAESVVGRLKNGTGLADAVKAAEEEPSLRAAVIRDAKKFRSQASPDVETAPEVDLAAQMQRSIDILERLKAAKAAGKLTDSMVQGAIDAGVTPALIKKVTR